MERFFLFLILGIILLIVIVLIKVVSNKNDIDQQYHNSEILIDKERIKNAMNNKTKQNIKNQMSKLK